MKKVLFFLAFIALAAVAGAQNYVFNVGGQQGLKQTPVLTATGLGVETAAYSLVFQVNLTSPIFYEWSVRLQQIHALNNTTSTIAVYGALENASAAYKQIGSTITWHGTTADTCAVLSSTGATVASALNWKYYKFTITPGDTVWVEHVLFNCLPANK